MIAVDGDVIRAVAPKYMGVVAEAQAGIIGAIEGVMQSTLCGVVLTGSVRFSHSHS